MIIYVYYTESLDLFHFLVLSTFVVNLIQKPKPVLLKNQLARYIQSKSIQGLGGQPLNIIFFSTLRIFYVEIATSERGYAYLLLGKNGIQYNRRI